jgi:predicted CopG family antitoxin
MAVKTITIDMEAYGLLARRKRVGQSFSQVIKAHFGRQPTVANFLTALRATRLGEETLNAVERQVKGRRSSPARTVKL